MAAYVILDAKVQKRATPSTLEPVRRACHNMEANTSLGEARPKFLREIGNQTAWVAIEFPSLDEAKRWYYSPEYQAALPGRLRSAKSNVIIVEEAWATVRRSMKAMGALDDPEVAISASNILRFSRHSWVAKCQSARRRLWGQSRQ